MGYPGEQGQSGGRRPAAPPPEEPPHNVNDPYSFPAAPAGAPGAFGLPEGAGAPPPVGAEGASPYAFPNSGAPAAPLQGPPWGEPPAGPDPGGFPPGPYDRPAQPDPYGQGGMYGQGGFGDHEAAFGQNGLHDQGGPGGQHDPYGQGGFGGQNGPYGQGGPQEQAGYREQGGPYGPQGQGGPPDQTMAWGQGPEGAPDPYAEFGAPAPPGGFGQPGPNPGGPDEFGRGPGLGAHGAPADSGRNKKLLIIGAVVGAVVLLGGGALAFGAMGGGGSKAAASASTPAPTAASSAPASPTTAPTPSIDPSGKLGAKLKQRTTDPAALTTDEVFKNAKFDKYTMTNSATDTDCTKAVHGSSFSAAIKKGDCTQLLRATYITSDGKLIGTIGIANLSTEAAAKKAASASSGSDSYLVPLPGDSGPSKKMSSKAVAKGSAQVKGHYLILSWVQRPDGKDFASGQTSAITAFVTQVPLGSNLDNALQYRGIAGKPYGA